jgi:hypothetical protein
LSAPAPHSLLRRALAVGLSVPWATLGAALADDLPRPALAAVWLALVAALATLALFLDGRLPSGPVQLLLRVGGGVVSWMLVMPIAVFAWLSPYSSTKLREPSDCIVPLARTDSCQGESDGFTECHYQFRAEGLPREARCRAFLTSKDVPLESGHCTYESPAGWRKVACEGHGLPTSFECFRCDVDEHERARHYVDAFAEGCRREIVLVGCNMDPGGVRAKR